MRLGELRGSKVLPVGLLVALVLAAVVVLDIYRKRYAPSATFLSALPLLVATVAVPPVLMQGSWRRAPLSARLGLLALLACTATTGLVAIVKGVPMAQVAGGAVSLFAVGAGAVVGYVARLEERSWLLVRLVVVLLLLTNATVAVASEFRVLDGWCVRAVEGALSSRGHSHDPFRYATGLFRTSEVFVGFLALAALCISVGESRAGPRALSLLGLCMLAGVLTARRSGLGIVAGAVLPYFVLSVWDDFRDRRGSVLVIAAGILTLVASLLVLSQWYHPLAGKLTHLSFPEGLLNRVRMFTEVRSEDWELLTWEGEGLGSHRFAVRAAGQGAVEAELQFLRQHPVIHFSWFGDLLELGVVGALLHGVSLLSFLLALRPQRSDTPHPGRWSGFGAFLVGLIVYYFVSPSLMLTVSNGLFSGLMVGFALPLARADAVVGDARTVP